MDRPQTASVELSMQRLGKIARIAALATACLCAVTLTASAAPARPPALDTARQALVKAIAKHDWNAVAALTNLRTAILAIWTAVSARLTS